MFRRFILALIVALAIPAAVVTPACARDPVETRVQEGHGNHAQPRKPTRSKPSEQRCIGCVAPTMLNSPMIEAPAPALLLIPAAYLDINTAFDPRPPALRPPRLHG
jgi:hypothetical protein